MGKHFLAFLLFMAGITPLNGQLRFYKYPPLSAPSPQVQHFGVSYTDPYKVLENINSDTTKVWLQAQNKFLEQYKKSLYAKFTVCERMLYNSITDLYKRTPPEKKTDLYIAFTYDREGLPILYYKRLLNAEYEQLCPTYVFQRDPKDKIFVRDIKVSRDNKYVAISVSHNGSDWRELRVRDIEGKSFLPEKLNWLKFTSVIWDPNGFYYCRYDEPEKGHELTTANKNQRMMYHRLGTPVESDVVILSGEEKGMGHISFYGIDTDRVAIVQYTRKEKTKDVSVVAYFKPDSIQNGIKEFLIAPADNTEQFSVVGFMDGKFLVKSTFKAPNGQLLLYDPEHINTGQLLIEQFNQPLRSVHFLKDRIFCIYYDMGKYIPAVFNTKGVLLKKLDIPDGFAVSGFNEVIDDSITLYTLSSFAEKSRTVKFDFKNLKTILYDEAVALLFHSKYKSQLVYYYSKDSTRIPLYLVYNKKVTPDTSTPALMYAYGGFGVSTDPFYNPGFDLFLSMGGILAVPLIRGGGDYGESWHKTGMRLNKQKSFDDFIAAAEYLIKNKYTSANKLAIQGGSNGGLLVAAAMVQRPGLFKAVVPQAAVLDLINLPHLTAIPEVGLKEYGNPEDSADFINLYNLSPVHHLKKDVQYPACMLITSTNDDRVVPTQSYRFLAALQNDTKEKIYPYLLYSEENQGHIMEGSMDDFWQISLMYTFIFENLDVDVTKMFINDN